MPKSIARTLTLAVAPTVLLLSACAAGLSNDEVDACNAVLGWQSGGHDPDWFDHDVADAADALSDVEDSPLAEPLAALAGSAEEDRAAYAEAFLAACADHGWELPEG